MGPLALLLMHTASATSHVEGVDPAPNPPDGARFRLRPIYQAVPNPTAVKGTSRASGMARGGKTGL